MQERVLDDLLKWATSEGVQLNKAKVVYCGEGRGCGIFATDTIRQNEVFIKVPKHLILTAGVIADMPEYRSILEKHRLEAFPIMVLFFYLESKKPGGSFFTPYLNSLPRSFDTPLAQQNRNAAEHLPLDCLPSRTRELLLKQRDEFDMIKEQLSKVIPSDLDLDHLNWAWHVVNTRCVYIDNPAHELVENSNKTDTIAVVPVMDMLNHDPKAQCIAYYEKRSQLYCVGAEYTCAGEGDELFVCYGPHDNSRLWVEYGFSMPRNIFNRLEIPIPLLCALATQIGLKVTPQKQLLLQELGISNTMYLSDIRPSFGMLRNVFALMNQSNDIKKIRSMIYNEIEDTDSLDENVFAVLEKLGAVLRNKRDSVPKGLQHFWQEQIEVLDNVLSSQESGDDD